MQVNLQPHDQEKYCNNGSSIFVLVVLSSDMVCCCNMVFCSNMVCCVFCNAVQHESCYLGCWRAVVPRSGAGPEGGPGALELQRRFIAKAFRCEGVSLRRHFVAKAFCCKGVLFRRRIVAKVFRCKGVSLRRRRVAKA